MAVRKKTRYPGVWWRGDVLYYDVKLANPTGKKAWAEIRYGKGTPKQASHARDDRQELEDGIRAGQIDPREAAMKEQAARPARELLAEYVGYLRGKGDSGGHVKNTEGFLKQCFAVCRVGTVLDLDPVRVNRWLAELNLSARSRNARRTAVTAFAKWAADFGRAPRNPVPRALIPRFDEDADRRRLSRAMDKADSEHLFGTLLDPKAMAGHCHSGKVYMRRARERRAFYLVAANTGLRWRETARLCWGDVYLDDGFVIVPAGQTKNGKQAELPLIAPVVDALREIRPDGFSETDKVFSGEPTLKTWKRDLVRAGIIGPKPDFAGYVDGRGRRLDRKCLRMSFCTWLKNAGVDLRDAQDLMRHSDPKLTARTYTDIRLADRRVAVEKLLPAAPKPAEGRKLA